jgi:hypothetical protein
MAGTPPKWQRIGAAFAIALIVAGKYPAPLTGGVQATTCFTPATFAGMMLICAEPNIGYRPPGI